MLVLVSKNMKKRGRVLEYEVFIENSCHGVGSKNAGRNRSADVVLGTNHVVLLANGFLRLIVYVRPPSLFREQVA